MRGRRRRGCWAVRSGSARLVGVLDSDRSGRSRLRRSVGGVHRPDAGRHALQVSLRRRLDRLSHRPRPLDVAAVPAGQPGGVLRSAVPWFAAVAGSNLAHVAAANDILGRLALFTLQERTEFFAYARHWRDERIF